MTGFAVRPADPANERPSVGSVVARLRGPNRSGLPPYVALPNVARRSEGAYLGPGCNPFSLGGEPGGRRQGPEPRPSRVA